MHGTLPFLPHEILIGVMPICAPSMTKDYRCLHNVPEDEKY